MLIKLLLFFVFGISSIINQSKKDDFNNDLLFIQKTLFENHPGVVNTLDPHFLEGLNANCKVAEEKLSRARSESEKALILKELGESFHDSHLWIHYDAYKLKTLQAKKKTLFEIDELKQGVYWITIPSFQPSDEGIKQINEVIQILPDLCEQTLVLDLRGNGGGNSAWGESFLEAIFGKEYVHQQLKKIRSDLYIEWRISEGNLNHVKEFIPSFTRQFGENHPIVSYFENIFQGMEAGLFLKEQYYLEPSDVDYTALEQYANCFKGQIYVIIDKGCGSACLDFLDGLKAMNSSVVFIGETTNSDSVYMELRVVSLPSGKGTLGFPIKVYRNRVRGHNVPHQPDIQYDGDLKDTLKLQKFLLQTLI